MSTVFAIALPYMGGIGAPELIIISMILMIQCFPVLVIAVVIALFVRSQSKDPKPLARPQVAAGWLSDPSGRHQLRYWDGSSWSSFVSDDGAQGVDPP